MPLIRYAFLVFADTIDGVFAEVTRNGLTGPSSRAAERAELAQMPPTAPAASLSLTASAPVRPWRAWHLSS